MGFTSYAMLKITNVTLSAMAIILISLFVPAQTLFAHGGSHHASSEQKQKDEKKIEDSHEEMQSKNYQDTQKSSTPKAKITVNMDKEKNMPTNEKYKIFNLLPKTSELVFLGLIISPFLLKFIRKGIHNSNGG